MFLSSEEEATRSVVLLKSLEGCLWIYRTQDWEAKLSALRQQLDDQQSRLLMHYLVAQSLPSSVDTKGRLAIPPPLMEYANIKGEVVIIGLYDRLELWSPIHWDDFCCDHRCPLKPSSPVIAILLRLTLELSHGLLSLLRGIEAPDRKAHSGGSGHDR